MADKKDWTVHIAGPDDIIGSFTELEAHRKANEINKRWLSMVKADRMPPLYVATVIKSERRG